MPPPFAAPFAKPPTAPPVLDNALERLTHTLDKLNSLPSGLRQAVADGLWRSIPVPFREAFSADAQPVGTALQLQPAFGGLVKVTAILATVPDQCTGTVTLGDLKIYVSAGTTLLQGLNLIVNSVDTRALTTASTAGVTSGPTALLIMGEQLPTDGYLAP